MRFVPSAADVFDDVILKATAYVHVRTMYVRHRVTLSLRLGVETSAWGPDIELVWGHSAAGYSRVVHEFAKGVECSK